MAEVCSFYESLKARLMANEWQPGERLPSIRRLVVTARVSYHTVVSAYNRLVTDGLIESEQGRGYFVTKSTLPASYSSARCENLMPSEPLYKLLQASPDVVKLGCGWLPAQWRDTQLLARSIKRTASLEQRSLVEYGDIQGYIPLRKQLSRHIRRNTLIDVPPNQILTTLGATQALDLLIRLIIKPGDHVFVDEPGNGNLIRLLRLQGAQVIGVPRLNDGPCVDFMRSQLAVRKVKAFICNTTYHNPTGGCITAKNAFQVLRLALENQMLLIEDDVYGDFFWNQHQTLAEMDGLENVIYIGSFSKSLSASLRIGYIACSLELVEPLVQLKLLTSVAVPGFCERFVSTILADGTYLKHTKSIHQKLLSQQCHTQEMLRAARWKFDIDPDGGMFLWAYNDAIASMPDFIRQMERSGILLMPGSSFAVEKDFPNHLRINVAHFNDAMGDLFLRAAT